MHKLILHGTLEKYGKSFDVVASTAGAAISLIARQIDGLYEDIKNGSFRIFVDEYEMSDLIQNGRYLSMDMEIGLRSRTIHVIPALQGSGGDNGVGKIILGAIIMIGAVVAAPFTGGVPLSAGLSAFSFGTYGATAFSIGAAIALSGISQLISPTVQASSSEKADEQPSYFMSSPINMANENGAIPILFGECFAGSYIINASLSNVDLI